MMHMRLLLVFLFDLGSVVVAWVGAFLFRFNFDWPFYYESTIALGLIPLVITQIIASRWAGLYRGMWTFASIPDLRRVLKAVLASALVLLMLAALARSYLPIPRSIVILYPILLLLIMGGGRISWRMLKEHYLYRNEKGQGKPIIVIGAGTAGAMLVRELERSPEWNVVALVDDDRSKWGLELSGRRVEGGIDSLADVLARWQAQHVILAMPSAPPPVLQRATTNATQAGANVFTVPGLSELMSGRVSINSIRPVRIQDLLGRETVKIEDDHVATLLAGKRLLVTGAGGSIGSELCRQLARFNPAVVVLVESNEYALYRIEQWFKTYYPNTHTVPLAGDVKDRTRMENIFHNWNPHIIYHAAAYKHVPLMEVDNAWEAVRNNALGTLVVAQCAQASNAERFILISTDKAVNPTNVMGATKRVAEIVCESLYKQNPKTLFQVVRFGNVLGSTGSVIPKFQKQIERGGPVTVTHPDITRYFMSIPEAAQLVLQASAMGKGGEVFVLDMGEPVKIVDLARNMIRLSGFTEEEIPITFTGLRPGEKLYEELLADTEATLETPHEKLRIMQSRQPGHVTFQNIQEWISDSAYKNDQEVRTQLKAWVPEYQPTWQSTGHNVEPPCTELLTSMNQKEM
ncbi:nucleoside-diphosphate sugar epimerase/dehydratase [Neopusillimonas maritima]|uniref:Polysaccharide biosynthesis protein n=1 Tax=Neopusillimonas maritima TaxID=2026239 RepID=A0ABX9MY38_9BURK|nr:nucleoside-diphosphate sugar epimerase/dehydratase [Neopusillimonas maritima]RII83381.1 polysaccharide biosynthesis protein [Neopusillimonas maritima]